MRYGIAAAQCAQVLNLVGRGPQHSMSHGLAQIRKSDDLAVAVNGQRAAILTSESRKSLHPGCCCPQECLRCKARPSHDLFGRIDPEGSTVTAAETAQVHQAGALPANEGVVRVEIVV